MAGAKPTLRPASRFQPGMAAMYFHILEDDQLDEELVARWIRQASELPGWVP